MRRPPQSSRPHPSRPADHEVDGDWPVDPGRPLGLRLLALVGAFSFLMIGLSVVLPLLQPQPRQPKPLPGSGAGTLG